MRDAKTVLAIVRERGKRGLPLEDVYRMLYNPDLYLRASARLYTNEGAMTKGTTEETVDSMALAKIKQLIDDVRREKHRWTPVRRVYIPKKKGGQRPLGLPTWKDKLLQEVMRSILEAYYEPQMSQHSHGFRPGRGCHTALQEVQTDWTGARWFIEGDIAKFFDTMNHEVLLAILSEKIHDQRFLRLIRHLLESGYLEEWRFNKTLSGCPQGGVISPILSNIYLDKLDQYVEQILIPAYTRGEKRASNPAYDVLKQRARRKYRQGKLKEAKEARKQFQKLSSGDPNDDKYRRLYYVRYADDTLFGFAGPQQEAEEIKQQLGQFLRDTLKLEMSQEKTLITHASTEAARFLNYHIVNQQNDTKHTKKRRCVNGHIGLLVPPDVVESKCAPYQQTSKPIHRTEMLDDDDFTIIEHYQQEYRGIVQYYKLAHNVSWFWKLHWIAKVSLLKTLARKHQATAVAMLRKYEASLQAADGTTYRCLEIQVQREGKKPLVARFGGIPLKRQKTGVLVDQTPIYTRSERNELVKRLLADTCELCGSRENVEVHHIHKLADLKKDGKERPRWVKVMVARRRKTLVVCRSCQQAIHAGQPTRQKVSERTNGKPDAVKVARPV
jgi:group II intron reverse transcriptase/maturase